MGIISVPFFWQGLGSCVFGSRSPKLALVLHKIMSFGLQLVPKNEFRPHEDKGHLQAFHGTWKVMSRKTRRQRGLIRSLSAEQLNNAVDSERREGNSIVRPLERRCPLGGQAILQTVTYRQPHLFKHYREDADDEHFYTSDASSLNSPGEENQRVEEVITIKRILPLNRSVSCNRTSSSKSKSPVHIPAKLDHYVGRIPAELTDEKDKLHGLENKKSSLSLFYKFFETSVDSWFNDWENPSSSASTSSQDTQHYETPELDTKASF